jgi:hypothetical protein
METRRDGEAPTQGKEADENLPSRSGACSCFGLADTDWFWGVFLTRRWTAYPSVYFLMYCSFAEL